MSGFQLVESGWVDGNLVFRDKATGTAILTINGATGLPVLPNAAITAASLGANLKTGFIPLPLTNVQIIGSDAIPDTGNYVDGDTAPEIIRVNGATDKATMLQWASSSSVEVQWPSIAYPPDLDDAANVEVHLLARMAAGGMDTPVIAVGYFEGIGDTNAGGNTAALSTTLAELSVAVTAANIGAQPSFATVTLTPGAHTNEALQLFAAWIEYTRRT